MSPDPAVVDILTRELPLLREKFSVRRVALFGSAATGTMSAASDVDILVELDKPIGLAFVELCDYIQEKLGKKVDVLTQDGLRSIRRQSVAENIQKNLIYV